MNTPRRVVVSEASGGTVVFYRTATTLHLYEKRADGSYALLASFDANEARALPAMLLDLELCQNRSWRVERQTVPGTPLIFLDDAKWEREPND
jgi:hypothetical protein